jgi:outer membrane immunogenic protein
MKKFLLATVALASLAIAAPAFAADLPVKAPPPVMPALYNWSGIYLGVQGGAVLGQTSHWTESNTDEVNLDVGHPLHGGFVGGEVGINFQAPGSPWVFGIEADGNWAELEESLTCGEPLDGGVIDATGVPPDQLNACGSRIDRFATVRGRLGYAFGPRGDFLVFVTGGAVWAHQSERVDSMPPTTVVAGTTTLTGPTGGQFVTFEQFKNTLGWTAGIGAEYGITPWLSLKGEVLYVGLGGKDYFGCPLEGCDEDPVHIKHSFILARMGLNWRFGWVGKGKAPVAVVAKY